ncbi:8354_t:CDS:2 [Gigaspora margarita]|uniref:8354_t:CDS:1 n=1 Tax=Gigaspora margarita TaxID=4874 RepID=A0ABN7VRN6_GIGMA|nr:8354_t:CDS:2 [Gigaspora margarita]
MNSQSLNSPQRILLKGFYNHDSPEEFNLPRFEEGNVVLATSKFHIVDYASKERNILVPKKTKTTNEAAGPQSIAKKIATRINANHKNENSLFVNKISSGIVEPYPANSKASTKNEDSLFTNKTSSITNPSTTNSKNKKKLFTNKNKLLIKPSSEIAKPSTRTRTRRQLTDLAKEALANSNEQAAIFLATNA